MSLVTENAAAEIGAVPTPARMLSVGAESLADGRAHFRVWADDNARIELMLNGRCLEMESDGDGYFARTADDAHAGDLYTFRFGGKDFPDPASRFQPEGCWGQSQIVDPRQFAWTDQGWNGVARSGAVIYEMHVGTFTPEGTFAAAAEQLRELADLGVTIVELMPLPEFPGRFGWGYDGVNLFAPTRLYGEPDDVRRFVDRAHAVGIGVILDVVYNHYGPGEELFLAFSKRYFSDRYRTDWGKSPNFDDPGCGPVREYFIANAGYWIDEFHMDGLRLDATQNIYDASADHIIAAIARRVRETAKNRTTLLIAENEPQDTDLVRSVETGGFGLDALWNDDFHHIARVTLTGRSEGYYSDYRGTPQEFISAVKYGYLYQGQWYRWQKKNRGTPTFDLPPATFVNYIQNHDQIANSARSWRCHALSSPGQYRAITAILLLAPGIPMLFQGQEFAASSPFHYFADFPPDQAVPVWTGRIKFLSQFPSIASPEVISQLPNPADPLTFEQSKLDLSERASHAEAYALHRDLLRLRREDAVFRGSEFTAIDGAVLGADAFVLRLFGNGDSDRLLLINLGPDRPLNPIPEPLVAPQAGRHWELLWSSEHPRYGGGGTPEIQTDDGWILPGHAALVLKSNNV
jgi:maltooligosyltrehalose trehalohydrolase